MHYAIGHSGSPGLAESVVLIAPEIASVFRLSILLYICNTIMRRPDATALVDELTICWIVETSLLDLIPRVADLIVISVNVLPFRPSYNSWRELPDDHHRRQTLLRR
jgi:hypothetical protein